LSPLHQALSTCLDLARELGATALVVGMPRGLPEELQAEARHGLCEDPLPMRLLDEDQMDSPRHRAAAASTRLRSSVGRQSTPLCFRIGDTYVPAWGFPVEMLIGFLWSVQERLVSLNASEEAPKPARHIEYTSVAPTDGRHFAEVELWLDEDNTVRIEIFGHQVEPATVCASPYVNG
jgi:hypothetical protein